jgi:hypothetical protein
MVDMTLKALVHAAQQQLQAATGSSFKRTHLYELLAASFGFRSYAALTTHAVFAMQVHGSAKTSPDSAAICRRCLELGYSLANADHVGSVLPAFLTGSEITVLQLPALVASLREEFTVLADDEHEEEDEGTWDVPAPSLLITEHDVIDTILLESLEAAAGKGIALAHYALALIHDPNRNDDSHDRGSAHWYAQAQEGKVLTGAPREWAEAHAAHLARATKHAYHLREAARMGEPLALLDLADQSGDPAFFEQDHLDVAADPAWVADLAERFGRDGDACRWLALAAENGDTEAMRKLIQTHDAGNLTRCWTWIYLAELLGTDLTEEQNYAIHEDGSAYDDDTGGPVYVGGRDRIELEPLAAEKDELARQSAIGIFRRIRLTS